MKTLKTFSNKKDILSVGDLTSGEIFSILKLAEQLKSEHRKGNQKEFLRGRILGMLFQKPSTRTRVSFEAGISQMGGTAIYLGANDIQLSRGESIEDTARTLALYVDCLVARVFDHTDIQKLAQSASIPVINGLSDLYHPCQILADLLTIKEHKQKLSGLRLAWIGDGDNVCNDLMIGCAKTGINMIVACPNGYEPLSEAFNLAKKEAKETGASIEITHEPNLAVKEADIVVTDTFISIGKEQELSARSGVFLPKFQVNSNILNSAKSNVIFMHCLPAKRGQEVTSEVIDGTSSVVWDEAENRMHIQKALLYMLMKNVSYDRKGKR